MFCSVQLHILYWVIDFFESLVFELLVYSCYQSLVWCIASKDFLPFCEWPLHFRDYLFCCAEAFEFHESHLSILSLSCWAAWGLLRKSLVLPWLFMVFCVSKQTIGLIFQSLWWMSLGYLWELHWTYRLLLIG
jgi:hypothetical protein